MFLKKLRNILRNKILFFFKPITYINFFSKKDKFKFITKRLRTIYYESMAEHDLIPIRKVRKFFQTNEFYADLFIDTHDFSNVGQIIDPDWEENLFEYYKKINLDKIYFIDLGGNIGCHSLFFLNYINFEKIIYVEPNNKCYELFKKSLSIQNSSKIKNVVPINKAIAENSGTSSLKFFKNNSGSASIVNYFGKKDKSATMHQMESQFNHIEIQNITIPELLNGATDKNNIIIKMDIQGYEPKILSLLTDFISKYNITHCFFEVNQKDENVMFEAIKKFEKDYVLKDLNNNIIKSENLSRYFKKVVLLEKK